jgi:6-phosphogluconolactonase
MVGASIVGAGTHEASAGDAPADVGPATRGCGVLYVGSYGHGIGRSTLDPGTGLPEAGATTEAPQPSYLALSADRRTLYAVNELTNGTVSAFSVRADGTLRPLGSRSSGGSEPCYVEVHPDGKHLLTANYASGSVAVHPILRGGALGEASDVVQHTGSGPDPERQRGPHAHKVLTDPAGRFVHAVDLGSDAVFAYQLRDGKLVPAGALRLPPGSGPRHVSFHPSGAVAYVTNELTSTLTVLRYDAQHGRLTPAQTLPTAPRGDVRNYPSEVVVARSGRFVYVANRGHNSIGIFAADADRLTARGTVPCGGNWPRHIALSGDERFLYVANQLSNQILTLRVDPSSGALTSAGDALTTGSPTMVLPITP